MTGATLAFRRNTATREHIRAHLQACDGRFLPSLGSRVDIDAYAGKLADRAAIFEAWNGDLLVGLVAAYMNDRATRRGHVTNTSVAADHEGRGVASRLMRMCLDTARESGMSVMTIEVSADNPRSMGLCSRFGFGEPVRDGRSVLLRLQL